MILLLFSFCSSSDIHYFSFNNTKTYLQHVIGHDITKLGNKLKMNDQIFFIDSHISNKNAQKIFNMIENHYNLSLVIIGLQTKIILNTNTDLNLKNANLTIKNITFINCDSSSFNIIDGSLNLYNTRFFGNCHFYNKALLNLINCTSTMTEVDFKNHQRPLIFSNSSILLTQYLSFDNITIESSEHSVISLNTASFENSYAKLANSNVSHFLKLDNSNVFVSNLNSTNSIFTSNSFHSIFSNILVRFVFFKKCQGSILTSVNDSTFHISNVKVSDHLSEYPLFTVLNASLSISDSQFLESKINSLATLNLCSSFFFTNSTILYSMSTKTLFELQRASLAEFSQIMIYRLISQTDIGIIHAINCDYVKFSQALIEGCVSQIERATSFAFSDISSVYFDDLNYTRNGIPLMITSQSNVVFANSYLSKNDCIEYEKLSEPSSFITLLTESSFHFINSKFIGNLIPGGFSLLSVDSIVFFKKITFARNNAPLQFIQSDVKLSKSSFRYNSNRVIESHFSNINVYKCLFSTDKKNLQIFAGNETKIIVNTSIVNSTYFIEADPSASSITIGSGRFLYSYKRAIAVDTKRTKLFLFDTQFNCSIECEKIEMKSVPNTQNNIFESNKNEFQFAQTTQILLKNVKEILNNESKSNSEINNVKSQTFASSASPIFDRVESVFMNNQSRKRKDENEIKIQINSKIPKNNEKQAYKENISVIRLPNAQINVGYQVWIIVFPVLFLFSIIIYRFKSQRFRSMSKKIFSPKGRYQL